ncbi:MAG: hypothetical protein ABW007_13310 [Chitinophagaceae bacterium]
MEKTQGDDQRSTVRRTMEDRCVNNRCPPSPYRQNKPVSGDEQEETVQ